MDNKNDRIAAVEAQIRSAYSHTKRPSDDYIVTGRGMLDDDCVKIRDLYAGRNCFDIDARVMFKSRLELSYLTREAFVYFLPGFMIGVLKHDREADMFSHTLIPTLCQTTPGAELAHLQFQCSMNYTKPQRDAIRAFLRFFRDEFSDDAYIRDETEDALRLWDILEET